MKHHCTLVYSLALVLPLSVFALDQSAKEQIQKARDLRASQSYSSTTGERTASEKDLSPEDFRKITLLATLTPRALFERAESNGIIDQEKLEQLLNRYNRQLGELAANNLTQAARNALQQARENIEKSYRSLGGKAQTMGAEAQEKLRALLGLNAQQLFARANNDAQALSALFEKYKKQVQNLGRGALADEDKKLIDSVLNHLENAYNKQTSGLSIQQSPSAQTLTEDEEDQYLGALGEIIRYSSALRSKLQDPSKKAEMDAMMQLLKSIDEGTSAVQVSPTFKENLRKFFSRALVEYNKALKALPVAEYDEKYALSIDVAFQRFNALLQLAGLDPIASKDKALIKKAFRQANLRLHPDKTHVNPRFSLEQQKEAAELLKKLVSAREELEKSLV